MSMPEPMNPYDGPQTPPPGMSSGAKVLLGLGIGCGVLVLLCCGGVIITTVFFGRSLQQAASEDPATVRLVTESIVAIEVPAELEPKFSLDWTMPIVDRKMMTLAIYASGDERSALMLFQMSEDFGSPDVMEAQFKQSMREAGRGEFNEVEVDESEDFKSEINGREAEFKLGKGKRQDKGHEVWQAIGSFRGKGGVAMMFLQLDAEKFTKDDLLAILKSMH